MKAPNFAERLKASQGMVIITVGLAKLIEEGHTPHEAFNIVEDIKRNTFNETETGGGNK